MGLKGKLPLLNSSHKLVRLLGYVVYAFVILILIGIILPSPDSNVTTSDTTEHSSASGSASASDVQTYSTSLGDVSIEIPYELEPTGSSGTALQLAKPGMVKPVLSIILQNTWGEDLENYAAGMVGEGKTYTEMTTGDGHRMLFYTLDGSRDMEGKTVYNYYAFIDYLADKNVVIEIFGPSKTVLNGDVIAEFGTDAFKNICRSFTFVS